MPDMTWQCKCPEAAKVYVLHQYSQFALVCNGYNQLEFLARAGTNLGDMTSWSNTNTYGYQLKHAAQTVESLASSFGRGPLSKIRNGIWNLNYQESGKTEPTSTYFPSSSAPTTTAPTPIAEPYASGVAETFDNSASASGAYQNHRNHFGSSSDSNTKSSSTPFWSSSTTSTTEKPKRNTKIRPKKNPEAPNYPVSKPEPTEKPTVTEAPTEEPHSMPEVTEDKGCTYMGRNLKKGQSFKPPWGCALYCNGNNSLFRKCS
ncbi:uncharacterized protein [Argopecten irradians]|uniref:uncharacterized protein n=1 Tax=Argopecten irradians TaxID=31199 RepID=UPI00371A8769